MSHDSWSVFFNVQLLSTLKVFDDEFFNVDIFDDAFFNVELLSTLKVFDDEFSNV